MWNRTLRIAVATVLATSMAGCVSSGTEDEASGDQPASRADENVAEAETVHSFSSRYLSTRFAVARGRVWINDFTSIYDAELVYLLASSDSGASDLVRIDTDGKTKLISPSFLAPSRDTRCSISKLVLQGTGVYELQTCDGAANEIVRAPKEGGSAVTLGGYRGRNRRYGGHRRAASSTPRLRGGLLGE